MTKELNAKGVAENKKIHIVGGGLVGTLAAIQLAQQGCDVTLYESRGDMRKERAVGGRSINLALTSRGIKALEEVGLAKKVTEIVVPMKGRMMHAVDENSTLVPYSKDGKTNDSVSREGLTKLLLTEAEALGVKILFNQRCTGYDPDSSTLTFGKSETAETVHAEVVIGADGGGATAVIHKALDKNKPDNYTRERLDYKYKELSFPAGVNGAFLMDKNALHIWSRNNEYMLIALPNRDGSFTGTLFLRDNGTVNFDNLTKDNVMEVFEREFPDALKLMPNLVEDFANNPVSDLHTVKCKSWHLGGKLLLIGDAAHAVVPFHGQGMNSGFEDCSTLGAMVKRHTKNSSIDWEKVFTDLEIERKPNTDALSIMSFNNLKDMLTTADSKSLLKRNIGMKLEAISEQEGELKDRFVAHYTMITFRPNIPYAQVHNRDRIQDEILEELAGDVHPHDARNWEEQVDWEKAAELVRTKLPSLTSELHGIAPGGGYTGKAGNRKFRHLEPHE